MKHKVRKFRRYKENFWFGHFHEFCDNAIGSNRRGPEVSVIKHILHAYVTDVGKRIIVSARHGFTEINFFVSAEGTGVSGAVGSNGFQLANRFLAS